MPPRNTQNIPRPREPFTGLCCVVCTEESCQSGQDCMHMPGVIYLPPPQVQKKSTRAPPPQSTFEMAPWAIYPASQKPSQDVSAPRATSPPSTQRRAQPNRRSSIVKSKKPARTSQPPLAPSQLIASLRMAMPSELVQSLPSSTPNSPPIQQMPEISQTTQTVESEIEISSTRAESQPLQTQASSPEFGFREEEWTMMTPPPLTWSAPYASDSPPHDEYELPDELPIIDQHLQQNQPIFLPSGYYETAVQNGSSPAENLFQNYLLQDTSSTDQQSWFNFLHATDDGAKECAPKMFGEDLLQDERWFNDMNYGGGAYVNA
ncbi:hypothetical protein BZA77DRAFT_306883 [Pyronema omphalodes]|nr:hypothetical protein BZA77DRAFT_306883 [Pyronema omphalodes]